MQLVLERRPERSAVIAIASPLIAVALTIVTFAALFAIMGKDPLVAIYVYFIEPLTDPFTLQEIAVKATPLVMIAVGLALCYIANIWNIGAEGQFIVGAVCGSWLAVRTNGTDVGHWVLPAMLVLGALGGALYALIPAICRVYFGASEILTSLMLVYVANYGMDYLVRGPWRDPQGLNFPTTAAFDPAASIPTLFEGGRMHVGSIITLIVVMLATVLLGRTIRGFEIRVVGAAPRGGALFRVQCRSAGALDLRDLRRARRARGHNRSRGADRASRSRCLVELGFTAIIVAFLGRLNPGGILIAGLFLALTFIGGEGAQISLKVPLDVTKVFQGILLFYVLACNSLIVYRIRLLRSVRKVAHAAS